MADAEPRDLAAVRYERPRHDGRGQGRRHRLRDRQRRADLVGRGRSEDLGRRRAVPEHLRHRDGGRLRLRLRRQQAVHAALPRPDARRRAGQRRPHQPQPLVRPRRPALRTGDPLRPGDLAMDALQADLVPRHLLVRQTRHARAAAKSTARRSPPSTSASAKICSNRSRAKRSAFEATGGTAGNAAPGQLLRGRASRLA